MLIKLSLIMYKNAFIDIKNENFLTSLSFPSSTHTQKHFFSPFHFFVTNTVKLVSSWYLGAKSLSFIDVIGGSYSLVPLFLIVQAS